MGASYYLTKALDNQKALTALYVPTSLVLIGTAFTTGAVVTAGATVGVTTSGPLAKELVAITPRPRTDASSIDPTIFFFISGFAPPNFYFNALVKFTICQGHFGNDTDLLVSSY